jgi:hypothetical protein
MRSWVVNTMGSVVVKPSLESFPHGFNRGFAQPKGVHSVHTLSKGELQRRKNTNKSAAAVRTRALIMHHSEYAVKPARPRRARAMHDFFPKIYEIPRATAARA